MSKQNDLLTQLRGHDWWNTPEDESAELVEKAAAQIEVLTQALNLIAKMDGDQPARSDWDMGRIARKALKSAGAA